MEGKDGDGVKQFKILLATIAALSVQIQIGLQVTDGAMTVRAMNRPGMVEYNPLLQSPESVIVAKSAISIWLYQNRDNPEVQKACRWGNVAYAGIIAWNVRQEVMAAQ